jgi:phytoene dehydrogenase-like protein
MIRLSDKLEYDAVVVGSGPNGFAAAITLARSGRSVIMIEAGETVGGGMRSSALTLPGFIHDICSAIHPLGIASPFFRSMDLATYGLEWVQPPIALAHPLDDGTAVLLRRSLDDTAKDLGSDGRSYKRLMGPITANWDVLLNELLGPLHLPSHPLMVSRFGLQASQSLEHFVRSHFKTVGARALLAGISAHSIMPTSRAGGAAYGLLLGSAGHVAGWPVAKGGSQRIADALKRYFLSLGGEVRKGFEIHSFDELPKAKAILMDVTPKQLLTIAGDLLPLSYRHRLNNYKYGPGVFKMDWALTTAIPWKESACLQTATVHLGGTFEEIAEAEDSVWAGKHPEKPVVILAQPSLFDTTRAPDNKHTAWAYCHVPNGSTFDMSQRIENQIERFAPGFRDSILARSVMNTNAMEAHNPNYIGGDIAGGVQHPIRLFLKPLGSWRPYATPLRGVYLCSSSMPPGAGVHGMCGYHAAQRALREVFGLNNTAVLAK